jgi:15-cis-phytoene synthase
MESIFQKNNQLCSKNTTLAYSTSFSLGVRMLSKEFRNHIYNIYGFVRYADEIVDTFLNHDRATLLHEFKEDTFKAIERGISLNPILDSFQLTVNACKIDHELIHAFLHSMEMDLNQTDYDRDELATYIYGSAEVVGLMCLRVFYVDDNQRYEDLKYFARKLGEAFQKVNFLRDAQDDFEGKGRIYFQNIDFTNFTESAKQQIEMEIQRDFDESLKGIISLKPQVRLGVYAAYRYYLELFNKIRKAQPKAILHKRFRVSNSMKGLLMFKATVRNCANVF